MLTQRNLEEAGKAIGVTASTLLRWMKEPEFDAAYRVARRTAFSQSMARLQQASSAAVSTVLRIMLDQNTPAATKLRAAECVISHTAKGIELEDIEARVAKSAAVPFPSWE